MNILILNWKDIKNPNAGGAELVTYEHAIRWIKRGHSVTWLASSFDDSKKEELIDGIKLVRFGNIYQIYLYAPYYYLFSGNKFDLVVDEVHGIPFFTPLYVRKPIVVLIHEIAGEIWDYMYSFPLNIVGKFLEKFYLKVYKNKTFWTDCKSTIDELSMHGIKKEKCISIPCPSNLIVLENLPEKKKRYTFISVSRIVKMKGIEDILAAFSIVQKKYKDARLIVVGDGEKKYVSYLKKEIINKHGLQNLVEFTGYVSEKEKANLLKKSHLLLHASVKEGWGIVIIEAASQGTPSVVYNVPGLSESVKNNLTGKVLENNTPEAMAECIINVISNENAYRKYQQNCLKWASSLNWDDASNRSLKFMYNIVNNE